MSISITCKDGFEFWSQKLHKNLDRKPLENYFANKRMQLESQRATQQQRTHPKLQSAQPRQSVEQPQTKPMVNSQPKESKPIVIPPLPFNFLWGVPKSDEDLYRNGETVYTFARRPGDMYNAHYWSRPESHNMILTLLRAATYHRSS